MRIVFLTQRYWPAVGGVERYVQHLAGALLSLGHVVQVVTGAHADSLRPREEHGGVTIHRFPARRSPLRSWWTLQGLRDVFRRADVIQVSDTAMLEYFYRMLAWSLPHRPLFLTRHGMSIICPVPPREKARARRAEKLVDGILHDGAFIAPWLESPADCVPSQGLYPPADELPFIPEPPADSATFIGRLEPDTGIRIYLAALGILRGKHGINMSLEVHGDGTLAAELQAQAERDALPVRFHGWCTDAAERLSSGCFALVDGRMAIHEAMARRRLVVAAWVNPLKRDYLTAEPFSPFLVAGGEAESIAAHVAHFVRHPGERRRLVDAAFAHVRTLRWERTAEQYLQLWAQAPRRQRQGPTMTERIRLAWQLATEAQRLAQPQMG